MRPLGARARASPARLEPDPRRRPLRLVPSLFGLTLAAHVPFVVSVAHLAGGGPAAWGGAAIAAAGLVHALGGRLRLAFDDRPISRPRHALELAYYLHWCGLVVALPAFLLLAAAGLLGWLPLSFGGAAVTAHAAGLALGAWGVVLRPSALRIREREVTLARLPGAFDGYRVLHVSDVHVGSMVPPARVARWVEEAARQDVDLVALTGDYVATGTRFHEIAAELLGALRGRDGTFAVAGNHDDFGGGEPLRTALRERGVRLLENEHALVERGGSRLVVVGVDDVYSGRADAGRAFEGVPPSEATLVLAHDPRQARDLIRRGADLVLAGHTHGGQLGVPWLAERLHVARPFYPHSLGLSSHAGGWVHTSPGAGTTGVPARLGVAPEMTVLVLRAPAGAPSGRARPSGEADQPST